MDEFAGLLGRACPAQVYEYVDAEESSSGPSPNDAKIEDVTASGKKFVINSQVRAWSAEIYSIHGIAIAMIPLFPALFCDWFAGTDSVNDRFGGRYFFGCRSRALFFA